MKAANTTTGFIPNIPDIPHVLVISRDILMNDSSRFTDGLIGIETNRGLFFPGLHPFFV